MKFYTAPEVAKMLRVRKAYIYELVAQGRLRAIRLSERRLRISEEALREFLEKEEGRAAVN